MSELRKANVPYATYFITLSVVGWIDVFTRQIYTEEIIKNLKYCQAHKDLEIFEYVIMPSHIHLICRRNNALRLGDLLRDFKSYSAKEILKLIQANPEESRQEWMLYMFKFFANRYAQNAEFMFWQKTNYPIELYSQKVTQQKVDYIHNNPVKAGIVTDPAYYLYSSACPLSPIKTSQR
ncbi:MULTISPECIES: REP-associated tyrosine transposase [unclassified Arcicella]|uniref:REP-associated tyrosine transposase n=1 Tax=unclassified Arcicella TaxID=2644986 RepID=UPI0028673628|nr:MULTISPECIES: transposase [unclassified Arcicella]MDR6563499.1 REP element-mobilizing transposase RayT [Arcicella sp. BE51]MDR6813389.1 REP element-mobilizing transposase RayT [Arcicella sp. BE140]MDR6824702.1 REP element-mobilizing transposase RayT [Arcicella sp. BE139]